MQERWTIAASATFGMESLVKRECEALGFPDPRIRDGRVRFSGREREVALANLALSVADRVLIEVAEFEAFSFDELFQRVQSIPWRKWISPQGAFPVKARSISSILASPSDIQSIVKKAIVRSLLGREGDDWIPEVGPLYAIEVVLRKNQCTISIDTTGNGLFQRGYREKKGKAPLKETFAAGLIRLSGWNEHRPMVDPFCGSGTLLIEAAMKARKIAPGLERGFVSDQWPMIGAEWYRRLRRSLLAQITMSGSLRLVGYDIDPHMIRIAQQNAEAAGVGDDIQFYCKDMRKVTLPESFGVVITNPPYGKRLGEDDEIASLMRDFSYHFLSKRTWSHFLLSSRKDIEHLVGRSADRKRKLYNGGIETTLYQFLGPNPARFLEQ